MTKKRKNFALDEIISIEDVGVQDTYDFTIPKTHCFFANGVLCHNTLEENADAVWLLHKTTDNEGNIKKYYFIIAKNRFGRADFKVNIKYIGKFYKFIDGEDDPPVIAKRTPVLSMDNEEENA